MQKRIKRPLAFLMILLMMLSVVGSNVTVALAEDKAEYISNGQPEGISVKAYAESKALPEGVSLRVKKVEGSAEYARISDALKASSIKYDNFMAIDIGFWDTAGNEVEPENGIAEVKLGINRSLFPEEIQQETLSVQQLLGPEQGGAIQAAADALGNTTGTISLEGDTVKAEFKADSFSIFAVTWKSDTSEPAAASGSASDVSAPAKTEQKFLISPTVIQDTEKSAKHEKYVTEKEDGTYDLTLTIAGAVGSQTSKSKLDVIYVLDKSGSMNESIGGWRDPARREAAGNAINTFTNTLAQNEDLDVRYSLVSFSGDYNGGAWNDANIVQDWTSDANNIITKSKPASGGGTNYQAGIMKAKDLLLTKRDGALTAVIFISDGDPSFYYDNSGKTTGKGSGFDQASMNAAKREVANLNANYFYTVGVGNRNNYERLKDLNGAATLIPASNNKFYAGTDEASLKAAFDDIQASITKILCSNVTITDTLSNSVQVTRNIDGTPKTMTVSVKDSNGNTIASGSPGVNFDGAAITARYDEYARQIVLDFPDTYQLKEGYTYQVNVNIEPTEAAYEAYRSNGNVYPDTGDPGTGESSAGKGGIFTNGDAAVTYTYEGKTKTETYPRPVMQLHSGALVIEKKIQGLENDEAARNYLAENLKFDYSLNDQETISADFSAFTWNDDRQCYQFRIEGLAPGTSYQVSERGADIFPGHAYHVITNSEGSIGIIAKDAAGTAFFTNTYKPACQVFTIEKQVEGNMGDRNKSFTFKLTLKNGGLPYEQNLMYTKSGKTETLQAADGIYTFTLKDDEAIALTLPYSCNYVLSEENQDYSVSVYSNHGVFSDGKLEGTLTEDTSAVFTNKKEVVPPTGIVRTIKPYFIMFSAALGILLLSLGRPKRRG
ncbi:vWA domain-containing protein [Novisyntrophococcus fermenticellae]|uniref:vWA domain-containing protein n=1 Tax=Novisyntrophococcus fermenticellae TaxID=2068655 RepID=UPI001E467C6E|nr:vWA domain-containing protein [Novisyntrophococcus fermenticellae]